MKSAITYLTGDKKLLNRFKNWSLFNPPLIEFDQKQTLVKYHGIDNPNPIKVRVNT